MHGVRVYPDIRSREEIPSNHRSLRGPKDPYSKGYGVRNYASFEFFLIPGSAT